jgi:hypothetical protein
VKIALRAALGTIIYTVIIVFSAPFPSAAGLLLTFPVLNGLGFYFSSQSNVAPMAKSMLWMPAINGALCAAYISTFVTLFHFIAPTALAWMLVTAAVLVWLVVVTRETVRIGIGTEYQFVYGLIATFVGIGAVAFFSHLLSNIAPIPNTVGPPNLSWQVVWQILSAGKRKIGLFVATLLAFLIAAKYARISDNVRGILAGLPFVPFGGLLSVAGDYTIGIDDRLQIFERMLVSVWLGPAVAIWFIYGYSKFLTARAVYASRFLDVAARLLALVAAWAVCFLAILAVASAL